MNAPSIPPLAISSWESGNLQPLLHEIVHAMQRLLESGESSAVDLRSLPLAPGEEKQLLDKLGRGEIEARLNTLGHSEIHETRYHGVWVVTHFNEAQDIIGRFIEIGFIPELFKAPEQDIIAAKQRLQQTLTREPQT